MLRDCIWCLSIEVRGMTASLFVSARPNIGGGP
jgi:hypothetical protein